MTGPFAVHIHRRDGATIACVKGEVDLSSAGRLATELGNSASDRATLIVDLSGVGYLDSAGLAVLDSAARDMAELKGTLRLVVAPESVVFRALEISGLSETIATFSNLDDAIAAVSA